MRLTEDLVKRVHREIQDPGPSPATTYFSEADYDGHLKEFLAQRPEEPIHVFCYGSLIWKPVFEPKVVARGMAMGWSRSFCLRLNRLRGTHEQPGLMMQIDREGNATASCSKFAQVGSGRTYRRSGGAGD